MFHRSRIAMAVAVVVGGSSFAPLATAQDAQRIEVTGSRIKTLADEGASPVASISAAEIKLDGVRNVESIVNNLPQAFAAQGATVANGSSGTATINLRNLGSARTLVLVNGRRMPMGSPANVSPDVNQIPAALIRRVDVLTGGASAVYGSDAVAGVVNFILDDRFQGAQVELNHSFHNHKQQGSQGVADIVRTRSNTNPAEFKVPGDVGSDGESTNFSLLLGSNFADNKGNATLFVGYKRDNALLQRDRDYSACALGTNAAGFTCGGSGTSAKGLFFMPDGSARTVIDGQGTTRAYSGGLDAYNFGPLNYYQRPSERYMAHATANYGVSDKLRMYAEFGMHDDLTVAQIAPGGAFGVNAVIRGDNPLLSANWRTDMGLIAGDPTSTAEVTILRRNVEGGGRRSEFRNTSFRSVLGARGDIGAWSYDIYAIHARVVYVQNEENYFLTSRITEALTVEPDANGNAQCASAAARAEGCVPWNVWRLGGVTADALKYLQVSGFRKGSTSLELVGANAVVDLGAYGMKLPTAKTGIGLTFGVERRREELILATDANTTAGSLSGSGGPTQGLNGGYAVNEIFAEARIPFIEGRPMAQLLAASLSARTSSYEPGSSASTYGLGLEYSPVNAVKARVSVQRAVRAPNLVELYTAQGNNLFDLTADPCGGPTPTATAAECARTGVTAAQYGNILNSPAGQYNFLQGGNPDLKPETANSITAGVVFQPMRGFTMSIDYFNVEVEDTISIVSPDTTLTKCLKTGDPIFCGDVQRDSRGTLWLFDSGRIRALNKNIGTVRTSGFDFGLNYNQRIGNFGGLGVTFKGTLLEKLETEELPGDGFYDCVGYYGPAKCRPPSPKWRHNARLTWNSPFNADVALTWRYIQRVEVETQSSNPLLNGGGGPNSNPAERYLAARNYFDLAVNYRPIKGLELTLGMNNMFDKDPPLTSLAGTGVGNGNTFPGVYDSLGRKVFINASYKF
jgi:outer membrane receptor protein involved in Fe transport